MNLFTFSSSVGYPTLYMLSATYSLAATNNPNGIQSILNGILLSE